VDAALVLGTDGLFPLLFDICRGARLLARHGDPEVGSGRGFLPGEGAQAFLLELRASAEARGARVRARLSGLAARSSAGPEAADRSRALAQAIAALGDLPVDRRIGGGNGLAPLDALEAQAAAAHPHWPAALHPKQLWGEFGGSGGQLLAAALLEPAARALITAPASSGAQFAALLEEFNLDPR
jgi:3-oxoacyl-[acyl-carrier-protein] synthase II